MDSRSLSQNKALFGSDLLTKFWHFARINVSTIRTLLSWMEGTIKTKWSRGMDWHLEMAVGVAGDGVLSLPRCGFPTCNPRTPLAMLWQLRSYPPCIWCPMRCLRWRMRSHLSRRRRSKLPLLVMMMIKKDKIEKETRRGRKRQHKGERVAGRGRNGDEDTHRGHYRWSFVGCSEWEEGEGRERELILSPL